MDLATLIAALALVFLNGFVAAEFALVKVRPSKIQELIDNQRPGARAVKDVVANLEGYVSATQLGVTFSSLGLGWLGGPSLTAGLRPVLESLGITQPDNVAAIGFLLAFTTIAFLHVVLGELAPKSLALIKPEAVALAVVFPLKAFIFSSHLPSGGSMASRASYFEELGSSSYLKMKRTLKKICNSCFRVHRRQENLPGLEPRCFKRRLYFQIRAPAI